jgi:hypothetical protein
VFVTTVKGGATIDETLYVVIIRAVFTLEVLVLVTDFVSQRSNGKIFFASVRDYEQRWNHTVGTRLKLLEELRYD